MDKKHPFMLADLFKFQNVNEWKWAEKFDGYRAQWVSNEEGEWGFISRASKPFHAPSWYKKLMPDVCLDGELWIGREEFQSMGRVRKVKPVPEEWIPVKFMVYDLPEFDGVFSERIEELKKIVKNGKNRWERARKKLDAPLNTLEYPIVVAKQETIKSTDHLQKVYNEIIQNGGEGVIIKDPNSLYVDKRSPKMLKYKPQWDEECIIVDYKEGNNKYTGMLGGFICKPLLNMDTYHTINNDDDQEFCLSGMDDKIRQNYIDSHPIGTVISYTHSGKTGKGKPRHGRYVRKRDDIIIKDTDSNLGTKHKENIIHILTALANNEKVNGKHFKSNAYFKAIGVLRSFNDDKEITKKAITSVKGIGSSLYEKIETILKTGTCPQYESIKNINDPRISFIDIYKIGDKKANELVDSGFTSIQGLRDCDDIENYLTKAQILGLKYYEDFKQKIPREEIIQHEKILKNSLTKIDSSAELTITGSYRRGKSESGDIDVLLRTSNQKVYRAFINYLIKVGYLIDNLVYGNQKYNGVSRIGLNGTSRRIDIMYTSPKEYPFAIFYFTGSDNFNKKVRKYLNDEKNLTINEHCISHLDTKDPVDHEFETEKDIFDYIDMEYVAPENRM